MTDDDAVVNMYLLCIDYKNSGELQRIGIKVSLTLTSTGMEPRMYSIFVVFFLKDTFVKKFVQSSMSFF